MKQRPGRLEKVNRWCVFHDTKSTKRFH
jgi:hypothetical protein